MDEKSKQKEALFEEYAVPGDFKEPSPPKQIKQKFTEFIESPWWTVAVVVLVAISAFSLGRLSALEDGRESVRVLSSGATSSHQTASVIGASNGSNLGQIDAGAPINRDGSVIASKNGTKYHYPWCAGAKQISPKNLITFNSIEEARAKGYTPAANCKGLK